MTQSTNLQQLIQHKKTIKDCELRIKELMPDCINEALELLTGQSAIIYDDTFAKITFKQAKEYDTPKNNGDLYTIDHEINEETQFIKDTNAILLKALDNRIEALQKQKEHILNTPKIRKLKQEYKEVENASFNLKPQLAVTIK